MSIIGCCSSSLCWLRWFMRSAKTSSGWLELLLASFLSLSDRLWTNDLSYFSFPIVFSLFIVYCISESFLPPLFRCTFLILTVWFFRKSYNLAALVWLVTVDDITRVESTLLRVLPISICYIFESLSLCLIGLIVLLCLDRCTCLLRSISSVSSLSKSVSLSSYSCL